jgi:NAD(P)-dependent dehydrogenase (short-subunit alcohol dehydrogenase family)
MPPTAVFVPGSTALITGGASGVGLAIAKLCRSKGMNVVIADRNTEALGSAKDTLSGDDSTVLAANVDVANTADWQKLKETAVSKFGSVELLVLNAGVGMRGGWGDEEYFRKVMLSEP